MALDLSPSLARRLIADPIMAAKVLMGAEFDEFQQAKFKLMWFTPEYMDHSGISVGKTELIFVWVFLRLILLPLNMIGRSRVVFVYYISQGTGERVFLPKITEYIGRSKIFKNELKMQRGGKYYMIKKNVIIIEMKNGGRCEIPAGDFMNDSDNQASTRGNDLVLDEIQKIDAKGGGVDSQLRGRITQESFNPDHPVHCNHFVYLGHAESPSHPSFKRYSAMRREYRKYFRQDTATVTSNYKDFTGEFYEKYGKPVEKLHRSDERRKDPAEIDQLYKGLWKRASKGIYSDTVTDGIQSVEAMPMLARENPETLFSLGWDSAPGAEQGADPNFGVVWAADRVMVIPSSNEPGYMLINGSLWYLRPVNAVFGVGWDVDQRSGIIHRLDRAFGFSVVVLDPFGGGVDIYRKLRERRQFIDNQWQDIGSGLCTPSDCAAWQDARPHVHFYKVKDPLFNLDLGERYAVDRSGPSHFMHTEVRGMMRAGEIAWPAIMEKRQEEQQADFSHDEAAVLKDLEITLSHYRNIAVRLDKLGNPQLSSPGRFQMYTNTGKKDGAMASNYGLLGLIARIKSFTSQQENENDSAVIEVF